GDLALGSPAQILHLGERAKELVLVVRAFLRQRFDQGGNLAFIDRPGGVAFCRRSDGRTGVCIGHYVVPSSHWRPFAPDIRAEAPKIKPVRRSPRERLVWRCRSPHHSRGKSEMRTSEPKPH